MAIYFFHTIFDENEIFEKSHFHQKSCEKNKLPRKKYFFSKNFQTFRENILG